MPQVPVYDTPRALPQEIPVVRQQTPPRLMQAADIAPRQMQGLGNAITDTGVEGMRAATLTQIQHNEAAAKDYDARLMGSIQGILYGTPETPDSGFMNQKGKNAVDTYDATVQKLSQLATDQAQTLGNNAQQQMVKTPTQLRIQAAIAQASQHRAQQSDVYQTAAGQTRIKVAQDGAALSFNPVSDTPTPSFNQDDPGANSPYQQYLQTIRSEATDLANRKGLTDPDVRDAFIKDQMGKAYVGVLAQMLSGKSSTPANAVLARKYFDAVKDNLSAEQQDKIRDVLDAGDNKNTALTTALTARTQARDVGGQEKWLDQQFQDGKINAEVHGMALQQVRAHEVQRRQEQTETDKSIIGTAWDMMHQGKTLADMSPGQIAYIKQRGLGPSVDAIFHNRGQTMDDAALYNDLMRMSAEDPTKFIGTDLATLSGQLSRSHLDHLIGVQTSINRQDAKGMEQNKIVHQAIQDVKSSLLSSGIDLSPKPNTDQAKKLADFESSLRDSLRAAQESKPDGKPLTREEARQVAMGVLKDQALAGTGYFGTSFLQTHKPVWQMTSQERAANWTIPDTDRLAIKASLARQGLPPSEENIQRVYKRAQGVR